MLFVLDMLGLTNNPTANAVDPVMEQSDDSVCLELVELPHSFRWHKPIGYIHKNGKNRVVFNQFGGKKRHLVFFEFSNSSSSVVPMDVEGEFVAFNENNIPEKLREVISKGTSN